MIPPEMALTVRPRLAYVGTYSVSKLAVSKLLDSAGLSVLLKIDGTRAIAKIHDPIEKTISCQCMAEGFRG